MRNYSIERVGCERAAEVSRQSTAAPYIVERRSSTDTRSGLQQRQHCHLETAARAELEIRVGRRISDVEWASARSWLIEFTRILCSWHRQLRSHEANVIEISESETMPKAA